MYTHYFVVVWALPILFLITVAPPHRKTHIPDVDTHPDTPLLPGTTSPFNLLSLNRYGQKVKDVHCKGFKLLHHSWVECWEVIFRSGYRPQGFTGPKTNREGNSRSVHSAEIHCCCHAIIISTLGLVDQPFCKALIIHCILWTLFVFVAFPLTPSCSLFLSPPPPPPPSSSQSPPSLQACVSVGCGVTSLLVGPSCVIERRCFSTSFLSWWNEAGLPGYLQKNETGVGSWQPATVGVCSTGENFRWDVSIHSVSLGTSACRCEFVLFFFLEGLWNK